MKDSWERTGRVRMSLEGGTKGSAQPCGAASGEDGLVGDLGEVGSAAAEGDATSAASEDLRRFERSKQGDPRLGFLLPLLSCLHLGLHSLFYRTQPSSNKRGVSGCRCLFSTPCCSVLSSVSRPSAVPLALQCMAPGRGRGKHPRKSSSGTTLARRSRDLGVQESGTEWPRSSIQRPTHGLQGF
ncbi:hypothetical protein FH972_021065 [Carpinus fangiana]|uniref:Uncharacterized protein n=1 Tax=Carpinus fangiana TaxID=176857 RepID=A0A5N6KNM3_9ROSI|nr:hypothetical protein FH972_021065 [Carpinus fangiana]